MGFWEPTGWAKAAANVPWRWTQKLPTSRRGRPEVIMLIEKPVRRMTLRQQLTHSEKCTRDLLEYLNSTLLPAINDLRDLSRPVRKRSHYPTLVAVSNSLNRVQETGNEWLETLAYLQEQLEEIKEHANRE